MTPPLTCRADLYRIGDDTFVFIPERTRRALFPNSAASPPERDGPVDANSRASAGEHQEGR
jgi:hypothetical protein